MNPMTYAECAKPKDPDALLDRAAKALLATRAPGLGKQQWARRAVATVIEVLEEARPVSVEAVDALPPKIVVRVIQRQCGGWIGTYQEGGLRFGVTAETEAETRAALDTSLARWKAILALPPSAHDTTG